MSTENTPELIGASDGAVRVAGATGAAVRLDAAATRSLRSSLARVASADADGRQRNPLASSSSSRASAAPATRRSITSTSTFRQTPTRQQYPDRRAGTVSLFGVSAASDPDGPTAGSGINQVLEITEIVDALHLSGDGLERLDVRFVPATAAVAGANFSIGRLSVFKLGE